MFMKIYNWIGRMELQVAKYALGTMTTLVFVAAIARTMGYPIPWATDGATFLFAWCVFLAADVAMRKDKLVCVDIWVIKLPKKAQYWIKIFNFVVIAIFLGFLVYYGVHMTYATRFRSFQGISNFSYSWVTVTVPIGALMMLVTAGLKLWDLFKGGVEGFSTEYAVDTGDFL